MAVARARITRPVENRISLTLDEVGWPGPVDALCGLVLRHPVHLPLNTTFDNRALHPSFVAIELTAARLHLHEHHLSQVAISQAVEDDEINRIADESHIPRIERKAGQIWCDPFKDATGDRGLTALDRLTTDGPGMFRFPSLESQFRAIVDQAVAEPGDNDQDSKSDGRVRHRHLQGCWAA